VGTGGLNIYSERRTVDNILGMSGGKANYFWKDELEYKWKDERNKWRGREVGYE